MRRLEFEGTEEGKVLFATVYTAFLSGPPAEDRDDLRVINGVQRKLDAASEEVVDTTESGRKSNARRLIASGATVMLEEAEYQNVTAAMQHFITKNARVHGKRMEEAADFLDAAPKEDVEPKPRKPKPKPKKKG